MHVRYWMSKDVITVEEDLSLMKASQLLKEHSIKHLPVVKNGRLAGIVSDRDLKEAQPSKATSLDIHELCYLLDRVKIKSLMSTKLQTINPEEVVEKAAAVMLEKDISALPVVNKEGELEGIVTKGDLFRAMIAISGITQAQLQFGAQIKDRPGAVKEVSDSIRVQGGRVVSIATHHEDAPDGFLNIYIRCKEIENEEALFAELEGKVKVLYRAHYKID
ncbi:MAG: CBS and ACT domain-containing protein [Deltaproteobacteria bacterium]|jgi:acetoin utilization protein AcuB